jgi:hypothetical protein
MYILVAEIVQRAVGAEVPRKDDGNLIFHAESDIDRDEFGREQRALMWVEMRRLEAGGEKRFDLCAQFRLDRLRLGKTRGGDGAMKIAGIVDKAGCAAGRGERTPAVMLFLGRDGQMHAEPERGIERAGFGDLQKPWARHHHRTGVASPATCEIEISSVRAVAHAEIVDIDDHPRQVVRGARAHAGPRPATVKPAPRARASRLRCPMVA